MHPFGLEEVVSSQEHEAYEVLHFNLALFRIVCQQKTNTNYAFQVFYLQN